MRGIVVIAFLACVFSGSVWADAFDDFAKAGKAGEEGNYQLAIDWYTKAINSGELDTSNLAKVYTNRGSAYDNLGQYCLTSAPMGQICRI